MQADLALGGAIDSVEAAGEERPIGRARQVVVLGIVADLGFGAAECGDVADAADDQAACRSTSCDALLAGDDGVQAALAVGERLLVLVLDPGLQDEVVLRDVEIGLFASA